MCFFRFALHVLSLRSLQAAGQQETEIKMKPKMIMITKMQRRSSSTQRRAVTRERESRATNYKD